MNYAINLSINPQIFSRTTHLESICEFGWQRICLEREREVEKRKREQFELPIIKEANDS